MALGITAFGADRIAQRAKPASDVDAWMSRWAERRSVPFSPIGRMDQDHPGLSVLKVTDIAALVGLINRTTSPEKSVLVAGATTDDVRILQRASEDFLHRAGRPLWRSPDAEPGNPKSPVLRKFRSLEMLETFWKTVDCDANGSTAQAVLTITQGCFAHMKPAHGADLLLPKAEAHMLRQLLRKLNLECAPTEPLSSANLEFVRVVRPGERQSARYAGLALKRALGVTFLWLRHRAARLAAELSPGEEPEASVVE